MTRRRRPNIRAAEAHDIAVKTARKIRNTIKDGLYDIWRIRNDIKHGGKKEHKWTETQVKKVIDELRRKTRKTEKHSVTEIMKWRKKKIDKWMERRQEEIAHAVKKQEDMKRIREIFFWLMPERWQ